MRFVRRVSLFLVLVIIACTSEDKPEDLPAPIADDDPGLAVEIRQVPLREPKDPAASHLVDRTIKYDLRVTATTPLSSIEIGSPLPLEITVQNAGEKPQYIYDLARSVREACAISVTPPTPGAKPLRFGLKRKEGGPSAAEDFTCLAPGDARKTTVDIAPLLARMDASPPGTYRIEFLFDSPFKGESFGIRAWNEMGYKVAASNPVTVDLTWPAWKSAQGVTASLEREIGVVLDAIGPDGRMDPAFRDLLMDMGHGAVVVLDEKLDGCSDSNYAKRLTGWNAFYALAAIRQQAMPYLVTSPNAGRPANLFLMELINEIDSVGPENDVAAILAKLRKPSKSSGPYSARLVRHDAKGGTLEILVHADGRVDLLEPLGERVMSRTAYMTPDGVAPIFEALHDNLFWAQRALRTSGSQNEALLRFALLDGQKPLHAVDVWETEALTGNRHMGQINLAFKQIHKAAVEELARQK